MSRRPSTASGSLDLTRYIPGPYCTMLLGDLGADVIKVEEPPIGDPTRAVPPAVGEDSAAHAALNRNKRSLVVDIRQEAGAAVVRRLAAKADVLRRGLPAGRAGAAGPGAGAPPRVRTRGSSTARSPATGRTVRSPTRAGHDVDYLALGGLLGDDCATGTGGRCCPARRSRT